MTKLCEHWLHAQLRVPRPLSRGTVRLASADPFIHPLIDPNYFAEEYDRAMSIGGLRLAREIMAQPAFRLYPRRAPAGSRGASDAEVFAYAKQHGKTDYHPVGTCKMGVDPFAVVDPELKVRGPSACGARPRSCRAWSAATPTRRR